MAACARVADSHHWLAEADLGALHEPLAQVRATAEQVLAEFETAQTLTRQAADALAGATTHVATVVRRLRGEAPGGAEAWVAGLTELRQVQGHLITPKDMRYADTDRIDELVADVERDLASFGQRAVTHLAHEDAFADHRADIEQLVADAEAEPIAARLDEHADILRTVTDVVSGLDIGDTTVRTSALERIAEVLGGVNRARATLDGRRRRLRDREGRAEFPRSSRCSARRSPVPSRRPAPPGLRRTARPPAGAGGGPGVPVRRVRRLPRRVGGQA